MTPYWTGSTPKRRTAPVSEGPSGALGATESVEGAVPGIPGSDGAQIAVQPRDYTHAEQMQMLRCFEDTGHAPMFVAETTNRMAVRAHCRCGWATWRTDREEHAR